MHDRWTKENIDRVASLASQGFTAAAIAQQLDVSRNAVIGLCHRRNIRLARSMKPAVKPRTEVSKPQKTVFYPPKFKQDSKGLIGDALWAGKGISVLEAGNNACRWPLAGENCCGQPIARGSYCARHSMISSSGKLPALKVNYIAWKGR